MEGTNLRLRLAGRSLSATQQAERERIATSGRRDLVATHSGEVKSPVTADKSYVYQAPEPEWD